MSFKLKHDYKIVALFSGTAFGLFFFLIVLIAVNNKVFKSKAHFYTTLDTAYGLEQWPPVFFKGYEIGRISKYDLTADNKIRVEFFVYEDFHDKLLDQSVIYKNVNPLTDEISQFEIINPKKEFQNGKIISDNQEIPSLYSELGQKYLADGKLQIDDEGIAGIVRKINEILGQLTNNQTTSQVNDVVAKVQDIMSSVDETVKSYNVKEKGEGSEKILAFLGRINGIMKDVHETLTYVKETIEVIHKNRKDIAPLIINTHKTLDKANDTLDGINSNPLIKGGIKKDSKNFGVEISD